MAKLKILWEKLRFFFLFFFLKALHVCKSGLWVHEPSEFPPASVPEAEADGHLWASSDCRYAGKVRWRRRALPPTSILLIGPPLLGFFLSNQQRGSQTLSQELADFAGLQLSVLDRRHARTQPTVQTDALAVIAALNKNKTNTEPWMGFWYLIWLRHSALW